MFDLLQIAIPFLVFLLFLLTILFMVLAARRIRDILSHSQRDEQHRQTQQEITHGPSQDDRADSGLA